MWSSVAPSDSNSPAPSARSKHSATLVGGHVYLLGGRNGNLPLKDFWKYNLATGKWQQLKPTGDKLPSLQEHTAVTYNDMIYVFGGEVGFSAGTETPLWVYDIKANSWRKVRAKKGVSVPKGRRGHTALVHRGTMLIYGGYQDLKGSCSDLWAFHFETESWHLISGIPSGSSARTTTNSDLYPPARHKHSAVLHANGMWIYGGMTDLQERSDLWRWDTVSSTWTTYKTKQGPGPLHSHAACRLPSSMIIFGGERSGQPTNELWKFHFDTELWEKISINGIKPQPRAETVAFAVSELLLQDRTNNTNSLAARIRKRTSNSADRGNRHSSYLPSTNNREKTYVFKPTQSNYTDGSDLAQQYSEKNPTSTTAQNQTSFLKEISKLSQINISCRINTKCSYTVLQGCNNDSTESLLKQHASPPEGETWRTDEIVEIATPTRGTMVKSKSAYAIKKGQKVQKHVEFDKSSTNKIPREPISVPNFSVLTLPTPVLTPVEAARLVFLDTDEENDDENDTFVPPVLENCITQVKPSQSSYENFQNTVKRGESYSSHLGYADNPLYQQLNSVKFQKVQEVNDEHSTSDYASIETVNRLSSASNSTSQDENSKSTNAKDRCSEGPFGFCNPNYMGPDIKNLINGHHQIDPKMINTPDSGLDDSRHSDENEILEMQDYESGRVLYRHTSRNAPPPKSLVLSPSSQQCPRGEKCRSSSASRAEKKRTEIAKVEPIPQNPPSDTLVPLYIFIIGGKEQKVTVFKRPVSVWKLKLF